MKYYKSGLAIILVSIVYLVSMYYYKPYESSYHQYEGDSFGYYVYLPAFFIHHDLADLHTTMTAKLSHCRSWAPQADSAYQNKYFMGTAVLQAPFFLIAHVLAPYFHEAPDGFSMIYMYLQEFSCFFYTILAFILLSVLLRRDFSDGVIAMVILIIAFATNLYFLVVEQATFSHPYLFFLYALLLFVTVRFYDTYRVLYLLLIGLVCGMIILTRFNEIYVVLIPIFWGIKSSIDISERIILFKKSVIPIIGAGAIMVLCIVPQILYWKVSSGNYLHYSYTGEAFDFRHPRIWDGLASACNGWLVYCPIMSLSLIGIWQTVRTKNPSFAPLLVFIPVHIYVIYSWWCWFYMGSYGSRPMTEAYTLLSFPLAFSVEWFWRSVPRKLVLIIITTFCSFVVMMQTYQSKINIFNSELSNWRYNLITLGKPKITYGESVVLETREFQPGDPVFVKKLGDNNFEDQTLEGSDTTVAVSGHRSICVTKEKMSPGFSAALKDINVLPGQWIRASVNCLAKKATDHNWHKSEMVIEFKRKNQSLKWHPVSLENRIDNPNNEIWHFTTNKWGNVYFYSEVPRNLLPTDSLKVYVQHNKYGADIYIDDLQVELYDNK